MKSIILKIYDEKGKSLVKSYEAQPYDLSFGTVRTLMEILKIDSIENQADLLKVLVNAWNEIIKVLGTVFPDCTDDEWNRVKVKELLPIIINIARFAIGETFAIPMEKN